MRWVWKRYALAVMGLESKSVVPLTFHRFWTRNRAFRAVGRLNLGPIGKKIDTTTHFAVWDCKEQRII
jgi:hypothetical protein